MSDTCGCCGAQHASHPTGTSNRAGLSALRYRVGEHDSFLAAMIERLSSADYPGLKGLTTREANDPAIALLDAWAIVAEVLSFYQERIANEGYLRSATERRSILELARLVGYQLRPGVAASTYLAFTIEPTLKEEVIVPLGTRAQSLPGQGQQPQPYETAEPLPARANWNRLGPQLNEPQQITPGFDPTTQPIYIAGTAANLPANSVILIDFSNPKGVYRLGATVPDAAAGRTRLELKPWSSLRTIAPADTFITARADLPPGLEADGLRTTVHFLRTTAGVSETEPADLGKLIEELAAQLLNIFAIAAKAPNPDNTKAVPSMRAGLIELRRNLQQIVLRTHPLANFRSSVSRLIAWLNAAITALDQPQTSQPISELGRIINLLDQPLEAVHLPERHQAYLNRDLKTMFVPASSQFKQLLLGLRPQLAPLLPAMQALHSAPRPLPAVYVMRQRASLFGYNVPKIPEYNTNGSLKPQAQWQEWLLSGESANTLFLDNAYDSIAAGQFVAILKPGEHELTENNVFRVTQALVRNRTAYGISAPTTELTLDRPWWAAQESDFPIIRGSVVYAQSELLPLALAPRSDPIPETSGGLHQITLDGVYEPLPSGRWLIISGERADLPGVRESKLVMLASAEEIEIPGASYHTRLTLANQLRYSYKRDTVTIYGNVVRATHGERREEVLGSGDGSKALQRFTMRQPPLTYLAAPSAVGAASTLELRVNSVLWHEASELSGLTPADHKYILRTDDEQRTSAIFGNGVHGARLPTGIENVTAVYRSGIGKPGNQPDDKITLLATRPHGVKAVTNPLPATGGADRESRDQARRNAPLAVQTLDRLVSVSDYADAACTFAGIGKAEAQSLSNGSQRLVYLTIAGADDIPIEKTSDLYRNLVLFLRNMGDPYQALQVELRELVALLVRARVRIHPDYLWEKVEAAIRAAMLTQFSFEQRALAQDITLGEVIATMQAVDGVLFVDVDLLEGIAESLVGDLTALEGYLQTLTLPARPRPRLGAEPAGPRGGSSDNLPAQLIYLLPSVPELLMLELLR
jgi:predicted phage baseplate assembly protein